MQARVEEVVPWRYDEFAREPFFRWRDGSFRWRWDAEVVDHCTQGDGT